jgi:hypothetical protein
MLTCAARSGSQHVGFLVENQLFELAPSSVLDTAYAVQKIGVSLTDVEKEIQGLRDRRAKATSPGDVAPELSERMLLSGSDGTLISKCLDIPEIGPEVERAVWQVERSIKPDKELAEEKHELEKANIKR